MVRISNIKIKKLESLYKLNKLSELEKETKNLRYKAIKNNLFNSKKLTENFAYLLNLTWKEFTAG